MLGLEFDSSVLRKVFMRDLHTVESNADVIASSQIANTMR